MPSDTQALKTQSPFRSLQRLYIYIIQSPSRSLQRLYIYIYMGLNFLNFTSLSTLKKKKRVRLRHTGAYWTNRLVAMNWFGTTLKLNLRWNPTKVLVRRNWRSYNYCARPGYKPTFGTPANHWMYQGYRADGNENTYSNLSRVVVR